jgi:DNA polymerase III delta prime subunit
MQEIIQQYKNNVQIHHFHVLVGDRQASRRQLFDFCETDFNCPIHGNQFFMSEEFDRLLIDDAKSIANRSNIKTGKGQKMVFVISFNDVTREAQNALLKVIEEPSSETYFFLIAPRKDIFLPTVLSRAVVIENFESQSKSSDAGAPNNPDEIANELLSDKTVGQKLKDIEGLVKNIKDGKSEKGIAREIVKKMIVELEKDVKKNAVALKTLQKVDDYLGDTSASVKLLLEKVVLSL